MKKELFLLLAFFALCCSRIIHESEKDEAFQLISVVKESLKEAQDESIINAVQRESLMKIIESNLRETLQGESKQESFITRIIGESWKKINVFFTFQNVLYYFGGLVVMTSMTIFITIGLKKWGGLGIFLVSISYAAAFAVIGWKLVQMENYQTAGSIFFVLCECMTPLCVLGIEKMLHIWPWSDVDQSSQVQLVTTTRKIGFPFIFPRWGRKKYVRMEIAVILVGIALLRKLPFPMLCLPMAISTWLLSNDAAFVFPGPSTPDKHSKLSALVGLVMLLLAAWLDLSFSVDYAFWFFIVGTAAFWTGLTNMPSTSIWSTLVYFAINFGMILLGLLYFHRVILTIFGTLGLFAFYIKCFDHRTPTPLTYNLIVSAMSLGILQVAKLLDNNFLLLLSLPALFFSNCASLWSLPPRSTPHSWKDELHNWSYGFINLLAIYLTGPWADRTFWFLIDFNPRNVLYYVAVISGSLLFNACGFSRAGNDKKYQLRFFCYRTVLHYAVLIFYPYIVYDENSYVPEAIASMGAFGILFCFFFFWLTFNGRTQSSPVGFLTFLFGSFTLCFGYNSDLLSAVAVIQLFAQLFTFPSGRLLFRQSIFCLWNALLVLQSILLNNHITLIIGALGVFIYIGHLAQVAFKDSIVFPFFLSLVGLLMIYLGLQYQTYQILIQHSLTTIFPHLADPVTLSYVVGGFALLTILIYAKFGIDMFASWELNESIYTVPDCKVKQVRVVYDPFLQLHVKGTTTRHIDLFADVYGFAIGSQFWPIIERAFGPMAVKMAKATSYPLHLYPGELMEIRESDPGEFYFVINTTKIVKSALNHLEKKGNPQFRLKFISYNHKTNVGMFLFELNVRASQFMKEGLLDIESFLREKSN